MVTLPPYHICLICTAIESPPQGGLPPQGALLSPAKWPWYGLHTAVVKKSLRRVCTKFAMLMWLLTHTTGAMFDVHIMRFVYYSSCFHIFSPNRATPISIVSIYSFVALFRIRLILNCVFNDHSRQPYTGTTIKA